MGRLVLTCETNYMCSFWAQPPYIDCQCPLNLFLPYSQAYNYFFFSLWSAIFSQDESGKIKGVLPRLKNISIHNFRGILGILIPIIFLSWQIGIGKAAVQCMWMLMFWFFLIQPIPVPCTGIIPVFLMPMAGVVSTADIAKSYFNEGIALFILSSVLILLLNNSGFDRRVAMYFICHGNACDFAGKRLILKCSLAAFFLSMFSNKLIVTSTIMQYINPVFMDLQSTQGKYSTEPNYDELRYILNNAIQTSASIGGTAVLHSAYGNLIFRALWTESCIEQNRSYPDIFNYLQYSLFAFPVAVVMFILNIIYHTFLMAYFIRKPMSLSNMSKVRNQVMEIKEYTVREEVTFHEKLTVFFYFLALLILFLRWRMIPLQTDENALGWALYNKDAGKAVVTDCSVVAIFVLAMHALPRSLNFTQFLDFTLENRSEFKNVKPESAILYWRFVDMNINYGYFLLIGGGVALELAIVKTELYTDLTVNFGKRITDLEWRSGLFVVCLITTVLANMMTGAAVVVIFLPFVLNMARAGAPIPWELKVYLPAIGVGIASSFGFMCPFLYTPAYFCHYVGKVPILKMVKYSAFSVLMCCLVLWFALLYWGPYLWDPFDRGFICTAVATTGKKLTLPAPNPDAGGQMP